MRCFQLRSCSLCKVVLLGCVVATENPITDKAAFDRKIAAWAAEWDRMNATGDEHRSRDEIRSQIRSWVRSGGVAIASHYANLAASDASNKSSVLMVLASLLEEAARLPECLEELQQLSELETRCTQKWYKIAIQKLLAVSDVREAIRMWSRARSIELGVANSVEFSTSITTELSPLPEERSAIPWPSFLQTPTVWMRGLRSKPFWECQDAWPVAPIVQQHADTILSEARNVVPRLQKAYPYLPARGAWDNLFLFRGQAWNSDVCAAMPQTCSLLKTLIPTKPDLPFAVPNNEEIVLFRSDPDAYVGAHSGATNNQLNFHLTLTGGEGVFLTVADERRELSSGKAICFQDSFIHTVEHNCEKKGQRGCEDRLTLVVRIMHPEVTKAHYDAARKLPHVDDELDSLFSCSEPDKSSSRRCCGPGQHCDDATISLHMQSTGAL